MFDIPERDWKLLRQLKTVALERFCERVLNEAVRIAGTPKATQHERYLKLYKFVHEQDRAMAAAFDDHRRSTALPKIAHIHSLGLFTDEEFAQFSEETRNYALALESL